MFFLPFDQSPFHGPVLGQNFNEGGNGGMVFLNKQDPCPCHGVGDVPRLIGQHRQIKGHGLDQGNPEAFMLAHAQKDIRGPVPSIQPGI